MSAVSSSQTCAVCLARAEEALERARTNLDDVVTRRNGPNAPSNEDFDIAVARMQDARDHYTAVALQKQCFCKEEITKH